jgi:hypothetical protein
MRSKTFGIGVLGIVIGVLLSTAVVLAGSLNPAAGPTETGSQMFSLQQIYDRLESGAVGNKTTTFPEPPAGPGGAMRTLDEIMTAAPALDAANGTTAANVASGKTFWGLTAEAWGPQIGTAGGGGTYNAGVPKTGAGAISGYPLVAGEDGLLQKGVAWPNPRFTDNSNGTVTDNLTGLIWLKNANCANATREWDTAPTDVASLNSAGTMNSNNCGDTSNSGSHQTDWRLPNVRELQSIVHYGFLDPAVPNTAGTGQWTAGDPFTGVQSNYYWTSTTYAGSAAYAWDVGLYYGFIEVSGKGATLYVWAVRGGDSGAGSDPTCTDGVKNGDETGVDCGGSCGVCGAGQMCTQHSDCQSRVCSGGLCEAPTCTDGVRNGDETDVDCGGSCATKCADSKACYVANDCQSLQCTGGRCQTPSCTDGVKNGDETDADCGGSCPGCYTGKMCTLQSDCQSIVCIGGLCQAATCIDGAKNGDETGVDCGGSCPSCP